VAVDLNPLVQEVVELTRARWSDLALQQGRVIELHTELAPELPPVSGVASEIRQALVGLVHNALDAMPRGGVLSLRTTSARSTLGEREVRVEVADSGVGMEEEACRRCVEPFFTSKQHRGAGLGLAIVYGVAQRHGAELEIRSAPGQGCSVALSFPHLAGPAVGGAWVPASARRCPGGRILLVDDDGQVLQALQDMLAPSGHCVVGFDSGEAAVDAFLAAQVEGTPFSAVITELGMPGVDVAQLAGAIKQASPQTPVIVLTGWGVSDNPSHLRNVDHVLGKPPCLQALRDALSPQQPFGH
jgi:CheY-like chemotaxis protein